MNQQLIEDIMLCGTFAGNNNLFMYPGDEGDDPVGVYVAVDDEGSFDYEEGIDWYSPYEDWNHLMPLVAEINKQKISFDPCRGDLWHALYCADIKTVFMTVVKIIKLSNTTR